jgi:hypothetical protein
MGGQLKLYIELACFEMRLWVRRQFAVSAIGIKQRHVEAAGIRQPTSIGNKSGGSALAAFATIVLAPTAEA